MSCIPIVCVLGIVVLGLLVTVRAVALEDVGPALVRTAFAFLIIWGAFSVCGTTLAGLVLVAKKVFLAVGLAAIAVAITTLAAMFKKVGRSHQNGGSHE